ncbi:hypothetical protein C6Y14_28495 [Streptomyces dioscori]|uniref:Uncharacterized protein n=1 Tax=Streptomyces dioscori TaxID=2109333 RepID=A0A2P8Q193_9ACTN|nr:hypothetical protein C6Y14_28495 [Streptomyces dioscori]
MCVQSRACPRCPSGEWCSGAGPSWPAAQFPAPLGSAPGGATPRGGGSPPGWAAPGGTAPPGWGGPPEWGGPVQAVASAHPAQDVPDPPCVP